MKASNCKLARCLKRIHQLWQVNLSGSNTCTMAVLHTGGCYWERHLHHIPCAYVAYVLRCCLFLSYCLVGQRENYLHTQVHGWQLDLLSWNWGNLEEEGECSLLDSGRKGWMSEHCFCHVDAWVFAILKSQKMCVLFLLCQSQTALTQLEENNNLRRDLIKQDVPGR